MRTTKIAGVAVITLAAVIGATGCATKKFVTNRVDPLSKRIESLESTNKEQGDEIEELQTSVSRADERAMTADERARTADGKAVQAGESAKAAQGAADAAGQEAERAKLAAEKARTDLSQRIDSLDDYQVAAEESVLFAFESSQLTDEAKQQLDAAASKFSSDGPFVIEIRGFTDQTGNRAYNLALSERRAQAVVRYLTTEHKVPLHRIFTLGLGSENPAADNKTLEGRKANRRVEVRVFVADQPAIAAELR